MCGRYAASANPDELVEAFEIDEVTPEGRIACQPRFNIAPTTTVPAIVERESDAVTRKLVALRWGLIPGWAKDMTMGAKMINARYETVDSKPAYRAAFKARRCLLPADGYYEWRPENVDGKQVKQPWYFSPREGTLAMAGIYELWKGPEGWIGSASILTTKATDDVGFVHDRMPMTVSDIDAWLDPDLQVAEAAKALAQPAADLQAVKVSRRVNNVRNDSPDLVEGIA